MFEDSLVESRGRFASSSRRWITAGSVGLQCLTAGLMVLIPILRPEALPFRGLAPIVAVPLMKKPPVVVDQRPQSTTRASSPALPTVMEATHVAVLPSLRPIDPEVASEVAVPSNLAGMGVPDGAKDLLGIAETGGPQVSVAPARKQGAVRVSAGVSTGLLLGKIQPVYPRIAVAARVEGVVVIEATISKTGRIESARVVSGPAMLAGGCDRCGAGSAVSALSAEWRSYRGADYGYGQFSAGKLMLMPSGRREGRARPGGDSGRGSRCNRGGGTRPLSSRRSLRGGGVPG